MLSQLVPAKIAKRMQDNVAKPEFFESVTVLYADICDIDLCLTREVPSDFITLVNDVYEVYEKRVDKYNVSKLGCTGERKSFCETLSRMVVLMFSKFLRKWRTISMLALACL